MAILINNQVQDFIEASQYDVNSTLVTHQKCLQELYFYIKLLVILLLNRALRTKLGLLQKWLLYAYCRALFMQIYKIKVKKVTAIPFRKYLGSNLSATNCILMGRLSE